MSFALLPEAQFLRGKYVELERCELLTIFLSTFFWPPTSSTFLSVATNFMLINLYIKRELINVFESPKLKTFSVNRNSFKQICCSSSSFRLIDEKDNDVEMS